jgi:hypothetical protein
MKTNISAFFCVLSVLITSCGMSFKNGNRADKRVPFVESVDENVENVAVNSTPTVPTQESRSLNQADEELLSKQATEASRKVRGQIRLVKSAIFDRVFLYGFDLQYSGSADPEYELILQSLALGHVPASFRRVGDSLQLVADQSRLFESNINHPELLINEYEIVGETSDTLTVNLISNGSVLNQVVNGLTAPAAKQVWVRSISFDETRNVLLQETGLLLADGSVQTFMESLLPRNALVPDGYKGLEANRDNEPLAERYRFIGGERVFVDVPVGEGEVERLPTTFANRFNLSQSGTIDWYVTPNAPEKFMPAIRSGVEGWNRYFNPQHGRDVIRFLGRLPEGVKLGDPSYNVINWDSVAEAGAAYESQAADPMTGIQSHSLIYLPYAWYNIGINLWSQRVELSQQPTAAKLKQILSPKGAQLVFGSKNILSCMRSAEELALPLQAVLGASDKAISDVTLDEFGKRLLTSTLFHEVGHALGLAHNFKGSLAFDGSQPESETNHTSYSVMDYNYFQAEMELFNELGGSEGPVLEYDRQIISQLYNGGKNVSETDPVIAACDDTEADNVAGGVDPLCVRYDLEKNPVDGVERAWTNLVNATGAGGVESQTLSEVLTSLTDKAKSYVGNPESVKTEADLNAAVKSMISKFSAISNYYIASGAQSLRINLRNNEPALHVWAVGVPVDENDFRTRYMKVLKDSMMLLELPDAPARRLDDLGVAIELAVSENSALPGTSEERSALGRKAREQFVASVRQKAQASLAKVRQVAYSLLKFDENNPFALKYSASGELTLIEEFAVTTLSAAVVRGLGTEPSIYSSTAERMAAAVELKSYKQVSKLVGETHETVKTLLLSAQQAGDATRVAECRSLLKVLE